MHRSDDADHDAHDARQDQPRDGIMEELHCCREAEAAGHGQAQPLRSKAAAPAIASNTAIMARLY